MDGIERLPVSGLLRTYADVLDELRRRKIVRSTNNPVADYAELIAARGLGLDLALMSVSGYDAKAWDGRRYQIKGRRITAENASRQLSAIRGLEDGRPDPFDVLVGILFNANFSVARAAAIPVDVVRRLATPAPHVNARRFILRDSVWDEPGVVDVTRQIADAVDAIEHAPLLAPVTPEGSILDTSAGAILFRLAPWTAHPDEELPRPGHGFRDGMTDEELRDSTRAWWVLDPDRARRYRFAAAVHGGVVRGVWEIDHTSWRQWTNPTVGRSKVRWGFNLGAAPETVRGEFVGKLLPVTRADGKRVFGSGSVVAYWPG